MVIEHVLVRLGSRSTPTQCQRFGCWVTQWQLGHIEVNEARRLKELERENTELKKMLTEEMLKNRVLSYVCEKKL